jgi:plastocyanin
MMKKVLFVALILAGMIVASGCSTQSPVGNANNTTININNVSVPAAPATPANNSNPQTYTVNVQNMAFNPSSIQIHAGDTVKWINMDSVQHQIKGDTFDSGPLNQNGVFEYTFNQPGTYNYICSIHPSMKGTITVVQT